MPAKARGGQHFIGHKVTGGTVGVEQGLAIFNVTLIPNTRVKGCWGCERCDRHDVSQSPPVEEDLLRALEYEHIYRLIFAGKCRTQTPSLQALMLEIL